MSNKNTGISGHFGTFSATAQLPNVVGATVQTSELSVGDLASVAGALYICTDATLGAAVWAAVGGGGGSAYVLPGTYTPTPVSGNPVITATFDLPVGFLRSGSGPGPQTGDVVQVFGTLYFTNDDNFPAASLLSIPLPFPGDLAAPTTGVFHLGVGGGTLDPNVGLYILTPTTFGYSVFGGGFASGAEGTLTFNFTYLAL